MLCAKDMPLNCRSGRYGAGKHLGTREFTQENLEYPAMYEERLANPDSHGRSL